MVVDLTWGEITLRLFFTVLAGTLIGIDRGEHGRPVGLRTTLLVCLAASLSMIQVNILLTLRGKAPDSFIVMDLMRLPLGILSGMGFIGAGAILRKDNLVIGVTTAATLWFVTVLGLCFGGGQIALGTVALVLGLLVLGLLKKVEKAWKQDRQANLTVVAGPQGPTETEITKAIKDSGCRPITLSVTYDSEFNRRELIYKVKWRARTDEIDVPVFVTALAARPQAVRVAWQP